MAGSHGRQLESIKVNQMDDLVDWPAVKKKIVSQLVAQGNSQKFWVDNVVFAPTSWNTTLRVLLAVEAARQMPVRRSDINNDEGVNVHMKQSPGFMMNAKVWKLNGWKRAAKDWNKAIDETLINVGYQQSKTNKSLYIKGSGENVVYIFNQVDDRYNEKIIAKTHQAEVGYFKNSGGEILQDERRISKEHRNAVACAIVSIHSQRLTEPRRGVLVEAVRIIGSSGEAELVGFSAN